MWCCFGTGRLGWCCGAVCNYVNSFTVPCCAELICFSVVCCVTVWYVYGVCVCVGVWIFYILQLACKIEKYFKFIV
jgi:hypothetical protein